MESSSSMIPGLSVEERLEKVSTIMDELNSTKMDDLVLNARNYALYFDELTRSMNIEDNPQPNSMKRVLEVLVNKGITSFLKKFWKAIMAVWNKKSEADEDVTDGQLGDEEKSTQPHIIQALNNCHRIILLLGNGTDKDIADESTLTTLYDSLAEFVLECLDEDLEPFEPEPKPKLSHPQHDASEAYISILHNFCNNHDGAILDLRKKGALQIVGKYRNSGTENMRISAIFTFSHLLSEDDLENKSVIELELKDIELVLRVLRAALDREKSDNYLWNADEMMSGVNGIAMVDNNKSRLIEAGVLPLYVEAMRRKDSTLQKYAAQGVWKLAFDENSVDKIKKEAGLIDALRNLAKSNLAEIRTAADGARWKLVGEAKHLQEIKKESKQSGKLGHIMISYQWDVKDKVKKVRERLREEGYRVWIDVEQMRGHTLEAMAEAVENAVLLVPVVTEKYKTSDPCRQELAYANKLKKRLVPLRMQPNYKADGWLGIIMSDLLYYDLTNPDDYEKKMVDFIRALGDDAKIRSGEPLDPIIDDGRDGTAGLATSGVPLHSAEVGGDPKSPTLHNIKCVAWREEEVSSWLKKHQLHKYSGKFEGFDGEMLEELANMLFSAPDVYYSIASKELRLDVCGILKLSVALRKLASAK